MGKCKHYCGLGVDDDGDQSKLSSHGGSNLDNGQNYVV